MGVKVLKCEDLDFVSHVIESIWDETCEDGALFEKWAPDPRVLWLEIQIDDERIGVYSLKPYSSTTIDMHAQVLPEHRRKFTQEITDAVHQFVLACTPPEAIKFITFIPNCHKNVIRYVEKAGWLNEGLITKCHWKDGMLYDKCIMGITRDQMQRLI
jgi:hypothetical protein